MIPAIKAFIAGNKLAVYVGGAVIVGLVAFGIYTAVTSAVSEIAETGKEAGAAQVTADNLGETMKRTEQGNEARQDIERNDDVRRASCLRNSRTPENC